MKHLATRVIVAAARTAGCASRDNDLETFSAHTKLEQLSGVAPLALSWVNTPLAAAMTVSGTVMR